VHGNVSTTKAGFVLCSGSTAPPGTKVYFTRSYNLEQFVLLPLPLIICEVLLRDQKDTGQILTASDKEHFKYKPYTCLSYLKSFIKLLGKMMLFQICLANNLYQQKKPTVFQIEQDATAVMVDVSL